MVGIERVRSAAHKGILQYAIVAPDASPNSLQKIVPLLRARRIDYTEGPSAAQLGAVAGRETTAAIGITDRQLARGIRAVVRANTGAGHEEDGRE